MTTSLLPRPATLSTGTVVLPFTHQDVTVAINGLVTVSAWIDHDLAGQAIGYVNNSLAGADVWFDHHEGRGGVSSDRLGAIHDLIAWAVTY